MNRAVAICPASGGTSNSLKLKAWSSPAITVMGIASRDKLLAAGADSAQKKLADSMKIPKSVQLVRDRLDKSSLPVTTENIKKALGAKEYNTLSNVFRQKLSDAQREKYKASSSDEARRDWVTNFVLDPATAVVGGFNRATSFNKTEDIGEDMWLTLEQLAGEVRSEANAKIMIQDLESRPSRYPSLAAAGVLEYLYTDERIKRSHGHNHEAGTHAKTELSEKEYEQVSQYIIQGAAASKPPKRKSSKPKVE